MGRGTRRFIDRMTKLTMETGTLRSRQLGRRLAMGPTEISASQSTCGRVGCGWDRMMCHTV
eukprot:3344634-Prymnesium_polylepis.1